MSSSFDSVCDIKSEKENWRIKVRVVRIWNVPSFLNPEQPNSIEMVLVDDKGDKIHASIRKQLIYMFQGKLVEGDCYKLCYFGVAPVSGSYRTTSHEYKLLFLMRTKVQKCEAPSISRFGLSLIKCDDVKAHKSESVYLRDVIGLVSGMSAEREYLRDGKITRMLIVEIMDDSGKFDCALFGEYVDIMKKLMESAGAGMPVIVVQFAKIKVFRENASIQNVMNTTRILINPEIPEVAEFKNGIAVHGSECTHQVALIQPRARISKEDDFLKLHPRKTVAGLKECVEDGVFVVLAAIRGLEVGGEFCYFACKCNRKVTPDSGRYYCSGCDKHVYQVTPRYRVTMNVSEGDSEALFMLFDTDVHYLIGISCAELVTQSKVENGDGYPPQIEGLIGKKLLFKVERKVYVSSSFETSFRVKRVCDDSNIIKSFEAIGFEYTPEKSVLHSASGEPVGDVSKGDEELVSETAGFVAGAVVTPPSPNITADTPLTTDDSSSLVESHVEVVQSAPTVVEAPLSAPFAVKNARKRARGSTSVKKNLSEVFEGVDDLNMDRPLKAVKMERE